MNKQNKMEKHLKFVDPELDGKLDELGFDWKTCTCGGFPECVCTGKNATLELVKKWFREEHAIDITAITHYITQTGVRKYRCGVIYLEDNTIESFFMRPEGKPFEFVEYGGYDEAIRDGILASCMLLKKRIKS